MLFDIDRVLSVCPSACRFHSAVIENLFSAISEKNRILVQKLAVISKRTTREKLISYLKQVLDKKVNNIKISNRLVDAPCVLTTDNFGWSANMERIIPIIPLEGTPPIF